MNIESALLLLSLLEMELNYRQDSEPSTHSLFGRSIYMLTSQESPHSYSVLEQILETRAY